jgi:transposase-like protein
MDARSQFCPNLECKSRGQIGQGNIVSHGSKRPRYKCKTCGKTFSTRAGTALDGIRKPEQLFVIVVILLAYGCPTQAIVHAFGLDERTVANWHTVKQSIKRRSSEEFSIWYTSKQMRFG